MFLQHEIFFSLNITIVRARMHNYSQSYFFSTLVSISSTDGSVSCNSLGKTLLTDTFNSRLKKRCLECGIRYLSSHEIRFSNCTMLLDNKVDIRDVQYAMGHTEQRMTEHYYRPTYDKPANIFISQIFEQQGELRATTEN